jgi:hypothetical protein
MSNPKMYADQLIEVIEKSVFVSWDPEIWHVVFCIAGSEMCEYQSYFHERIEQWASARKHIFHKTFYYAPQGDYAFPGYRDPPKRSSMKVCYPPVQEPQYPTIKRLTWFGHDDIWVEDTSWMNPLGYD